jgi:hypothetical protein
MPMTLGSRGVLTERSAEPRRALPEPFLRVLCAGLGMGSVTALLAWGFRLGPFAVWFWSVGAPSILLLLAIGMVASHRRRSPGLRTLLVAGAVGGLAGTIGYDAVRIVELPLGLRPYIPIDSYGVLMLGAAHSSPLTEFAGWAFNASNGIGFGVTYAMLARGRPWWWAIPYAFALETAFVVTPLGSLYQLSGHWDLIAMAYGAHVVYAYPLGKAVQNTDALVHELDALGRHLAPLLIGATVVMLAVVTHPWSTPAAEQSGVAVGRDGLPGAAVVAGRFVPEWLRVPSGGCVLLRNDDRVAYTLNGARGAPLLRAGAVGRVCVDGVGVVRVRTSSTPYAGGIVLVDPEMSAP